jgi:hypothetical protein
MNLTLLSIPACPANGFSNNPCKPLIQCSVVVADTAGSTVAGQEAEPGSKCTTSGYCNVKHSSPAAMHLQSGVSSKLWTNASSEQYGWYHPQQQLMTFVAHVAQACALPVT